MRQISRRHLAEQLEPRLLLAGDDPLFSLDAGPPAARSHSPPAAAPPPVVTASSAESDQESGFAVSIRRGIDEISRVISAIAAAPDMSRSIPYLGTLLPVDVGDTAVIDTLTIGSLFDLAGRFESEVATPLRDFLVEFPTATADQLVAEFNFLGPVSGLSGGIEGVRLNLESGGTVESSLAALLDPITAGENGILRAVDGDALATPLPLQYTLQGLRVDLLRDGSGQTAIGIPGFSIDLAPADSLPVNFAAAVGFLSGQVSGGDLQFDLDLNFDPAGLFRAHELDGSPLAGLIDLDSLRSISATEIAQQLRLDIGGSGLNLSLPFDFELPGFDPGSLLPQFTFSNVDPLDDRFPTLDLIVPEGVGYSAESLLAFHSIDATSVLGSLQQLGGVFESWQQGGPLNVPIPLSDNVTLGDAVGLAEGYSTAVLQFLRDGEGFPSFTSVQELAELIPAAGGVGPIESLRYDPETQHLEISLEFFRQGDGSFEITGIGGGLFASWFVGDPWIAPEYLSFGSVISSESLSARGFGPDRLAQFVVPPHLRGVTGPAATATLLDGSTHSLSVGLIDSAVRLEEIAEWLTITDGGEVLLRASIRDNRIVLEDKSSPSGPDARLSIEFETPSGPTKYFLSPAGGFDGRDGVLPMRPFTRSASGDALSMPQRPDVLVDTGVEAPGWTTVETLLERNTGQNLISSSHEADIRLRDGTVITWTIDSLSTTSIEDVVAGARWYRDGRSYLQRRREAADPVDRNRR